MTTTLGAILTGGRSTRMGAEKADVLVGGKAMLHRVRDAMEELLPHVVLLGDERPGFECWPDQVTGRGPLAGIATALSRMEEDRVLVVAVDQPFLRVHTLARLGDLAGDLPMIPVDSAGVRQVTCAIYPKSISEAASEEAEGDGSMQSLLDRVSFQAVTPETWSKWGEDGRSWYSVDTPEALEEGSRLYL